MTLRRNRANTSSHDLGPATAERHRNVASRARRETSFGIVDITGVRDVVRNCGHYGVEHHETSCTHVPPANLHREVKFQVTRELRNQ